jgi:uncharacterized protein DUF6498
VDLDFKPRPESALTRLVAWPSAAARKARSDPSTWTLVGANVFAAATAMAVAMSARELVLVYWAQSLFICLCGGLRFALLRQQRKRDFDDEAPPGSEPLTARLRAGFTYLAFWFVLHAGFVAVIFWNAQTKRFQPIPVDWPGFVLCLAVFAAHHVYSLVHNLRADAAGTGGDRGLLFVIPFFRMFPMAIISGVAVAAGADMNAIAIVFTAVMKSVADLISHQLEHQLLQTQGDDKPYVS